MLGYPIFKVYCWFRSCIWFVIRIWGLKRHEIFDFDVKIPVLASDCHDFGYFKQDAEWSLCGFY